MDHVEDIEEEHLEIVDSINARHISSSGALRYQGDNPFFHTFIEPSGRDTLKVFPLDKEWTCSKCRQTNWQNKPNCRGQRGSCTGVRPCQQWKWQHDKSRDEGLVRILTSANEALQWKSRSRKSMTRGGGGDSSALEGDADTFVLEELRQKYGQTRALRRDLARKPARQETRQQACQVCKEFQCPESCQSWHDLHAAMLCIGLDEYSHISKLPNAMRDAHALQKQANAVPKCKAEFLENPETR